MVKYLSFSINSSSFALRYFTFLNCKGQGHSVTHPFVVYGWMTSLHIHPYMRSESCRRSDSCHHPGVPSVTEHLVMWQASNGLN